MRQLARALRVLLCLTLCVFVLGAATGCRPALKVSPRTLLDDGRVDPMLAFSRYRDQMLRVQGVVVYRGLRAHDETSATHNLTGSKSKLRVERKHIPFMVLRDADTPNSGIVHCSFREDDLDDVAAIPLNTRASVRGRFQEYYNAQGEHAVALSECSLVGN